MSGTPQRTLQRAAQLDAHPRMTSGSCSGKMEPPGLLLPLERTSLRLSDVARCVQSRACVRGGALLGTPRWLLRLAPDRVAGAGISRPHLATRAANADALPARSVQGPPALEALGGQQRDLHCRACRAGWDQRN